MNSLTLFGFASVLAMLVAYALEEKGRVWILIFAGACFSSALYGLLADAPPFAVVESVWGLVALRKWRRSGNSNRTGTTGDNDGSKRNRG